LSQRSEGGRRTITELRGKDPTKQSFALVRIGESK
jgi:hypothetical protein